MPAQGEPSNDDEEVNRIVMRDIVAKATEDNKQAFIAESRRIIGQTSSTVSSNGADVLRHHQVDQSNALDDVAGDHDEDGDNYRDDLSDEDEEPREEDANRDNLTAEEARPAESSTVIARLKEIDRLRRLGEHIDRSVVTVDGACSQIQSLCGKPGTANEKGVVHEFMSPLGNDVIKGSAACSMAQNANDCGRGHSQLKLYARTKMKWKTRHVLPNMQAFIESVMEPLELDKGSLNTVLLFCGHLENMICKVWQPGTIRAGWLKSGLVAQGSSSDGGIDLKRILSHWIGFKELEQSSVQSIVALVPTLACEVVASTTVSDASMQQFQKYFPRPFIHYKKDRAELATTRGRSCTLLANEEMHRMRWSPLAPALELNPVAQSQEQPPHYHGWKDDDRSDKAERICDCKSNHVTHARFYKNNPKAWADHQKTQAHQKYLTGNVAADRMQTIGAAPFQPFSAHEYASKIELECLAAIAAELSFSKAHADKFAAAKIVDRDAVWLAQMSSRSMQALLGLPHALCLQFINRLLDLGGWNYNDFEVFDKNCSEMMSMHADE